MARSEEKAMNLLNRWVSQRGKLEAGHLFAGDSLSQKIPRKAEEVKSLKDALFWRNVLSKEIAYHITAVQDPTRGADILLEINDLINRRIKKRKMWDEHIIKLGGPDLRNTTNANDTVRDSSGCMYFGATRDLESVRNKLSQNREIERITTRRKSRGKLNKDLGYMYYEWDLSNEDPHLVDMERDYELKIKENELKTFSEKLERIETTPGTHPRHFLGLYAKTTVNTNGAIKHETEIPEGEEERDVPEHDEDMEITHLTNPLSSSQLEENDVSGAGEEMRDSESLDLDLDLEAIYALKMRELNSKCQSSESANDIELGEE